MRSLGVRPHTLVALRPHTLVALRPQTLVAEGPLFVFFSEQSSRRSLGEIKRGLKLLVYEALSY
jgi:hypothetical protein